MWNEGEAELRIRQVGSEWIVTLRRYGYSEEQTIASFPSETKAVAFVLDAAPVSPGELRSAIESEGPEKVFKPGVVTRRFEKGQALLETALILPIVLFFILAALDIGWFESQKSTFNHVVAETAVCIDTPTCGDPAAYAQNEAVNLGLNANNLQITINGKTVHGVYSCAFTGWLGTDTFQASAVAP